MYSRRTVTDGVTIMNKDLYDNLQDGIDELKNTSETLTNRLNSGVITSPSGIKYSVGVDDKGLYIETLENSNSK